MANNAEEGQGSRRAVVPVMTTMMMMMMMMMILKEFQYKEENRFCALAK
jgi:hypothetical protein